MYIRSFAVIGAALLFPMFAVAQGTQRDSNTTWTSRPHFEIVASVAVGHVFRFEDQGFGNHFNFGVGAEVPVWRKLRIGGEINKTFGFSPSSVKCGSILISPDQPYPCVGAARQGVRSATAGSITASYFFGEGRIQPYLLGGISIIRASEYQATSIVHQDFVEFRENELRSTGIGPAFGAGLRASLNRHLSIRPEIRFSDGTAISSLNLSQWRISLGAAYAW
jgi:opacity protein-like surface antigen